MRHILLSTVVAVLALLPLPANAATLTTLTTFGRDRGIIPYGGVTFGGGGLLYGTTQMDRPGYDGFGTAFSVDPNTGALTILARFSAATNAPAYGPLVSDAAGNLYGTTANLNGQARVGQVYRLTPSGQLTTLLDFTNGAPPGTGYRASGSVTFDSYGQLVGNTVEGEPSSITQGSVYRVDPATGAAQVLATRDYRTGQASTNNGLVSDAAGNLYGTTADSEFDIHGNIVRLDAGASALRVLATFDGRNGSRPQGTLVLGAGGTLFGMTSAGGQFGLGTIFRLDAGATSITTLLSFDGSNGARPLAGLIADANGVLFGATSEGGASNLGTLFRFDPSTSQFTTLISFDGVNGKFPTARLIADAGGSLFGTTAEGGLIYAPEFAEYVQAYGTVFRLDGAGFAVAPPIPGGVPEPASWALLIAGFGLTGAVQRRRRGASAAPSRG